MLLVSGLARITSSECLCSFHSFLSIMVFLGLIWFYWDTEILRRPRLVEKNEIRILPVDNENPYSGATWCIQEKEVGDQGLCLSWGSEPWRGGAGPQRRVWSAALLCLVQEPCHWLESFSRLKSINPSINQSPFYALGKEQFVNLFMCSAAALRMYTNNFSIRNEKMSMRRQRFKNKYIDSYVSLPFSPFSWQPAFILNFSQKLVH